MKDLSEYFIDYSSGKLTPAEERKLFSDLSYDDDARNEFRSYLTIDKTLKKTSASMMPSTSVTGTIFSNLGIQLPAQLEKSVTANKLPFYKSNLFTGIASGIAAAVTTFLFVTLFLGSKNTIPLHSGIINKTQQSNMADIPKLTGAESVSNNAVINKRPIIKYIHKEKVSEISHRNPEDDRVTASPVLASPLVNNAMQLKKDYNKNRSIISPVDKKIPEELYFSEKSKDLGFSLEIRGSANWNLPKETIAPSQWAKFNNSGISLLYNFFDGFNAGPDLRQETFFVQYNGYDTLQDFFNYRQQPNLTSYGIIARYNFVDIWNFAPFAQVWLGGNKYGNILRGGLGFEYKIYQDISLTGAAEYSTLYFIHQDKKFQSNKISMNYGFIIKF